MVLYKVPWREVQNSAGGKTGLGGWGAELDQGSVGATGKSFLLYNAVKCLPCIEFDY